jgi:tetratricopeptide (TPR) repeat protein
VTDHWIRVDANKAVIDWSILRLGPERRPLITLVADVDAGDDARDVRKGIAYYEYYKDHDRRTAYLDSAVTYLRKDSEQLRGSASGQFVMGQIEALRGNYQEAVSLFERTVTLEPKFADAYWRLGNIHHSMKRYDQAEVFYRKALEMKPADPQYFESLGMTLSESGNPTQAAEVLERAIHIDQENPDAYYYLGTIYARDFRDVRKALPYFERLVLLDPDYENAYLSLGAAYIATKRYREGIATLKKEIELRPASAPAFFNLGRAYIEIKDTLQAVAAFRRAAKLDPTMDIARQKDWPNSE